MTSTFHIVIAMKPLDGTFAENALRHGVAGLAIDACRIGVDMDDVNKRTTLTVNIARNKFGGGVDVRMPRQHGSPSQGRFPANIILSDSPEVLAGFPQTTSGNLLSGHSDNGKDAGRYGKFKGRDKTQDFGGDSGSAARFFHAVEEYEIEGDNEEKGQNANAGLFRGRGEAREKA